MDGLQLAMFGLPGGIEWVVIALVALLVFGRRLPDVARSVGKSIVEFKKGIKDVKDEIDVRGELEDKPTPRVTNRPANHEQPSKSAATDQPEHEPVERS